MSFERDAAALTGLAQLQRMARGEGPAPSMLETLGFRLAEVGEGVAVFEGEPGPHILNPMGTVHGGWAMTLLDSALGCAVHSTLKAGEIYASLGTEVKFLRPILPTTGPMRCTGTIVSRGRRTATSEGRLVDASGRLYASGTSTCFIQPMEA
ncbi:PaaI family thioesterase [Acuticoccus kandeliae]|uniref:PaaI family thioesterase n=1 Tax=Acuticoccus kandeliae TaxID=2073160 RepID=UPI000D3E9649|nr:PaaI family thioesterase [Acuticoccus kandeliae]